MLRRTWVLAACVLSLGCLPATGLVPAPSASPSSPAVKVTVEAGKAADEDVSTATFNGKQVLYQTATLIVAPKDPLPETLEKVLTPYGGQVVSQKDAVLYLIQFDLERVDLTGLEASIQALNKINQAPILTATFATADAAKTFKLFADLVTRHADLVENASLNTFSLTP